MPDDDEITKSQIRAEKLRELLSSAKRFWNAPAQSREENGALARLVLVITQIEDDA